MAKIRWVDTSSLKAAAAHLRGPAGSTRPGRRVIHGGQRRVAVFQVKENYHDSRTILHAAALMCVGMWEASQSAWSRIMALSEVSSLRMTATSDTLGGLPEAFKRA